MAQRHGPEKVTTLKPQTTRVAPPAPGGAFRKRDALLAKGWNLDRDLRCREAHGARHTEAAWAQRVEPILRFLHPSK